MVTKIFESVSDLTDFILAKTDTDYIATFSNYNIVDVSKSRKYWWVRGYVSHSLDLPAWDETREKMGYID